MTPSSTHHHTNAHSTHTQTGLQRAPSQRTHRPKQMGDPATLCYPSASCLGTPDWTPPGGPYYLQTCMDNCQSNGYPFMTFDGTNCGCWSTCTVIPSTTNTVYHTIGGQIGNPRACPPPPYTTCTEGYSCDGSFAIDTDGSSLGECATFCATDSAHYPFARFSGGNTCSCYISAACTSLTPLAPTALVAAISLYDPSNTCPGPPTTQPTVRTCICIRKTSIA